MTKSQKSRRATCPPPQGTSPSPRESWAYPTARRRTDLPSTTRIHNGLTPSPRQLPHRRQGERTHYQKRPNPAPYSAPRFQYSVLVLFLSRSGHPSHSTTQVVTRTFIPFFISSIRFFGEGRKGNPSLCGVRSRFDAHRNRRQRFGHRTPKGPTLPQHAPEEFRDFRNLVGRPYSRLLPSPAACLKPTLTLRQKRVRAGWSLTS